MDRHFRPFEKIFYYHLLALVRKNIVKCIFGLLHTPADSYPLAEYERAVFDDDRHPALANIRDSRRFVGKRLELCGRDAGLFHQILRKDFGRFYLRRRFCGAEYLESCRPERIDDTEVERVFGADDGECDFFFLCKREESFNIRGRNINILAALRRATIARSDVELPDARRLFQFPRKRVLPSPTSY